MYVPIGSLLRLRLRLQISRRAERDLRADMSTLQAELASSITERGELRASVAALKRELEAAVSERAALREEVDVALDERDEARQVRYRPGGSLHGRLAHGMERD